MGTSDWDVRFVFKFTLYQLCIRSPVSQKLSPTESSFWEKVAAIDIALVRPLRSPTRARRPAKTRGRDCSGSPDRSVSPWECEAERRRAAEKAKSLRSKWLGAKTDSLRASCPIRRSRDTSRIPYKEKGEGRLDCECAKDAER